MNASRGPADADKSAPWALATSRASIFQAYALIERAQNVLSSSTEIDLRTARELRSIISELRAGNGQMRTNIIQFMSWLEECENWTEMTAVPFAGSDEHP